MKNGFSGKTIVITGSSGFIGRRLLSRLLTKEDVKLVVISRNKPNITGANQITWVKSNLETLTREKFTEAGVSCSDIIFHLGAFTPKSRDDFLEVKDVYAANLIGTQALLEALPGNIERFIFSSTLDVYAPTESGQVLNEQSPLNPISLYGASKLFCEKLLLLASQQRNFDCIILRYGHIYGPGEGAYAKLIPTTIRRLINGTPPILYGKGSATRDLLYVEDVIEATMRAAVQADFQKEILNIVRGESISITNIVLLLMKITKFKGSIEYLDDKPEGVSYQFDSQAMFSKLGAWKFMELEEGLQKEVDYFLGLCS